MSVKQFERRHPTLTLKPATISNFIIIGYIAVRRDNGEEVAIRVNNKQTPGRVLWELSNACYKLASLEAIDRQNWKSANTGETGIPLEIHHKVKRSAGGTHAVENLAGVSREVHNPQHGQVQFSKRRTPSPSEA